jgi:hypothetical protein
LAEYSNPSGVPQYGVKMDFPDFLSGDFRVLEKFGAKMRSKHGVGTKRSIKFDDELLKLYVDIKVPTNNAWIRVDTTTAKEILEENREQNREEVKKLLGSGSTVTPATSVRESGHLLQTRPSSVFTQEASIDSEGSSQW